LWGLVVVRWRLELAAVDAWALDKGMTAAPSTLTGEARHTVAARLDTPDNHAAIVAFMGDK
jgi:predicted Ser/Thr protein kinase